MSTPLSPKLSNSWSQSKYSGLIDPRIGVYEDGVTRCGTTLRIQSQVTR